jgi:excisionase family DNA binding protein
MERPLTVPEAAGKLNYHPDHLGRLLRAGTVKGMRVGGRWLLDPAEVERIKTLQGKGGRLPKAKNKT